MKTILQEVPIKTILQQVPTILHQAPMRVSSLFQVKRKTVQAKKRLFQEAYRKLAFRLHMFRKETSHKEMFQKEMFRKQMFRKEMFRKEMQAQAQVGYFFG